MARTRRQFLVDSTRGVCGVALLGLGVGVYTHQARSHAAALLRPPGALLEDNFLSSCLRCGLCVQDCPYDTLRLAKLTDHIATGTPFFEARKVPCEMCDDIPCVKVCPSGALDPALTDIEDARMGLAVLIDQETCLNFLGLRCDVCYRVCPLIDEAITLTLQRNARTGKHAMFLPTVHSDRCTGCGKCEQACVLDEAAIKVLPRTLAKGQGSEHYPAGWKNQANQAGGMGGPDDAGGGLR